jgi:hypothetical protein
VPEIEEPTSTVRIAGSAFSLRILAAAIILLFFYYAAGVVITVLLSILLAYFLDPAVELLERMHVARTVGAMVMVLLLIAVLVAVGYGLGTRTEDFAANWPKYGAVLKQAAGAVEGKIKGIEGKVSEIAPETAPQQGAGERPEAAIVRTLLCAVSGNHVRAIPGVLHASGQTRGMARNAATVSGVATDAGEGDARGLAGCSARLSCGNDAVDFDGDCGEQLVLLDPGAGFSDHHGNCVGFAEYGAVHRGSAGVAAGVYHRAGQMEDVRTVRVDRRGIDGHSRPGAEFRCAANCWASGASERRGDHDCAAFLGLGVGWNGIVAGNSDYGGFTRDLRSHGILAADRTLA